MKSLKFSRSTLLQKHELKTVSLTEKQMQETEEVLGKNIALVSIPGHHWGLECLSWTWRWTWGIGKGWDIGVGSIFWSCCPRAGAEGGSGWLSTWQSRLLLPPHGTCPCRALLGFKVCLLNHWHYILNSSYVTKLGFAQERKPGIYILDHFPSNGGQWISEILHWVFDHF